MVPRPVDGREQERAPDAVALPGVGDGDGHLEAGPLGLETQVADDSGTIVVHIRGLGDKSLTVFMVGPAQEAGGPVPDPAADCVELREPALRRESGVEDREVVAITRSDRSNSDAGQ